MESGKIFTFYSYKGGTGRTMALANVACILVEREVCERGILLIDWDLEAPGLHRFFEQQKPSQTEKDEFEQQPGLIDFWIDFKEELENKNQGVSQLSREELRQIFQKINLKKYIQPIDLARLGYQKKAANISLMKAGLFDADYPGRVSRFNWEKLFDLSPLVYEAFAEELADLFDYVLIDSRTGITDTSGICTMIMPEKLIVVFVPNQQSLTGISTLVKKALNYRKDSDDLRPLVVFPLPSRIENSEHILQLKWRRGDEEDNITGYQRVFEELLASEYGFNSINLEDYLDNVQVLHKPYFAYGEKIAVIVEGSDDILSMTKSYLNFVDRLLLPSPWDILSDNGTVLEVWINDRKILTKHKGSMLIGRLDPDLNIYPDIDLTPYLMANVLKISRKQAWLTEKNGSWFLQLDENARSPVYMKDIGLLLHNQIYEIGDETRLGFGGKLQSNYLDMTLKITTK